MKLANVFVPRGIGFNGLERAPPSLRDHWFMPSDKCTQTLFVIVKLSVLCDVSIVTLNPLNNVGSFVFHVGFYRFYFILAVPTRALRRSSTAPPLLYDSNSVQFVVLHSASSRSKHRERKEKLKWRPAVPGRFTVCKKFRLLNDTTWHTGNTPPY